MISCILLASGYSRRFGSNKLFFEVNGKTMFQHALDLLMDVASNAARRNSSLQVLVVTQYPELEELAREAGATVIHNPDPSEGIAASVRLGAKASVGADLMVFFTADQPYLTKETVLAFLSQTETAGTSMASSYAMVDGKRQPGNPTAFTRSRHEELMALTGDVGGRRIMKKHPEDVTWIEIPAEEIQDVDTI